MADQHTHERLQPREAVKSSSNRSFGIVFTVVFAIIGVVPLFFGSGIRWWAILIAAAFLVLSLLCPLVLAPLNRLWTRFGMLLHHIVSPVIMGLLFFVVVTPIGLIMRAAGKRPLNIELDRNASSYWIARDPPGPEPDSMKMQF